MQLACGSRFGIPTVFAALALACAAAEPPPRLPETPVEAEAPRVDARAVLARALRAPRPKPIVWSSNDTGFRSVVRRENRVVEFGPYALEVDPADGGRIVSFSLDGRNVVLPREESPEAYGSSFWPSPQRDWSWPPPLEIDRGAWQAQTDGAALVLESRVAPKLGIAVKQRITPVPAYGAVRIDYEIANRGKAPQKVAPWQNTRVRPSGLTFYPKAARPAPHSGGERTLPPSSLELQPGNDGIVWFQHVPAAIQKGQKAFDDGAEGWLAHVDRDLLLIKVFPDVPLEAQAPTEAEIEIYADGAGQFVEVEQQGPYTEIAPGASSSWRVHWILRRLPNDVPASAGEARLVQYVRREVHALLGEAPLKAPATPPAAR